MALFDPEHVHHELAHDWFAANRASGWATCAITENGFVRVLTNPAYGAAIGGTPDLVARLRRFCAAAQHEFWCDAVSLRDEAVFDPGFVDTHRQLTDIYLLGLARARAGRLATFDRTIPLRAVVGAKRHHLQVIGPPDEP